MNRATSASFALASAAFLALTGCTSSQPKLHGLAADVDAACGGPAWRQHTALQVDITVRRKGQPDLTGVLFYDVHGHRVVLEFPASGGGLALFGFDGKSLWIDSTAQLEYGQWPALVQWATCVGVPYRLTDPALRVREMSPVSVGGTTYRVAEIQQHGSESGACALYVGQHEMLPRGAVPISSAGIAKRGALKMFAFAYDNFVPLEGARVPIRWSVWQWDAQGVSEIGPVASIALNRPQFVHPHWEIFDAPGAESLRPTYDEQIAVARANREVARGEP